MENGTAQHQEMEKGNGGLRRRRRRRRWGMRRGVPFPIGEVSAKGAVSPSQKIFNFLKEFQPRNGTFWWLFVARYAF